MNVLEVAETAQGNAVLLGGDGEDLVLPIFVGGTEALSIRLRLEGDRYPRPLTHDLLDGLVKQLGGTLWKVHVDELRGHTFVGKVFVRQGDRIVEVDARPSDAIALALGSKAPIFVARDVLVSAGILRSAVEDRGDGTLRIPGGRKQEPMAL
jgi:bifunctional DNase/RNase